MRVDFVILEVKLVKIMTGIVWLLSDTEITSDSSKQMAFEFSQKILVQMSVVFNTTIQHSF
jgi:hypothetical protein